MPAAFKQLYVNNKQSRLDLQFFKSFEAFRFLKLTGIFPLFRLKDGVLGKPWYADWIATAIYACFYSLLLIRTLYYQSIEEQGSLHMSNQTCYIIILVLGFAGICEVVLGYQQRAEVYDLYFRILETDHVLSQIQVYIDYSALSFRLKRYAAFMVTLVLVRSILMLTISDFPLYFTIFHAIFHILKISTVMQYCFSLTMTGRRYVAIKTGYVDTCKLLNDLSVSARDKIVYNTYILCRCYYQLFRTGKMSQIIWGRGILMTTISCFADLFEETTLLYVCLFDRLYENQFKMLAFSMLWISEEVFSDCYVIKCAEDLYEPASYVGSYLHKLCESLDDRRLDQMMTYSLQIMQQKFDFSLFGLMKANYSIIFTIVVTMTTYLIIFAQYDMKNNDTQSQLS